jgi:hypothetical protein
MRAVMDIMRERAHVQNIGTAQKAVNERAAKDGGSGL